MNDAYSGTILIVDDDIGIRELLQLLLDNAGIKNLTASNANNAIELLHNNVHEIEACLLDLNLGDALGENVYEQLRELAPNLAVFPMSGISIEEIHEKFENKEIAGIITKPFTGSQLIEIIRTGIQLRSKTQPLS